MADGNADTLSDGLKAWMEEFQDMDLDARAMIDPARAAGEVGREMRRFSGPMSFDRQPTKFLERLDAAGALDIARLNMVEFAFGVTGHNEITGPVHNPWNTDYITGGSS